MPSSITLRFRQKEQPMKNNWFCPNCGQPMEAQRHVDNPTGRITWTIGCLNPKHFHTHGYMNAAIAEIQLGKLLRQ